MTPMTTQEMDTLLSQAGDAGIIRYRYGKSATWADALDDLDADRVEDAIWHEIKHRRSTAPPLTPGDVRATLEEDRQ